MNARKPLDIAIRHIVDWNAYQHGTHYALIVDGVVQRRAVGGMTLRDLQREYRAMRTAQRQPQGAAR